MAKRHVGGVTGSPVRYGALLAAVAAAIVAVSTAIYVIASGTDVSPKGTVASPRTTHDPAAPASAGTWVASWSAAPTGAEPGTETGALAGSSVRNVVHTSVGGTDARITLSNLYGQQPLTISNATIAVAAAPNVPVAAPDTLRRLTFNGGTSVVIAAGQQVSSDAVRLRVPGNADVLVSTYSPTPSGPVTYHLHARQVSYLAPGDRTGDPSGVGYTRRTTSWRYLTSLDVLSNQADGTVVVAGDSLTDGITSTSGANRRWTDILADRLRTETGAPRYAVANEGISGNRLLTDGTGRPPDNQSGLARFQRDVLDRTGVRVVVIDLGINDILRDPLHANADTIVAGLRELTRRAHARGIRVVGATLMPFGGHLGATARLDEVRQRVNARIRAGGIFDATADFDRALRDPYNPRKLRPDYDSGDHLHPNDAGFERMGLTLSLSALKGAASASL